MDKISNKCMTAHRAAWIRNFGVIPENLVVCHKCDNGLCVNIEHLFLGTRKDNMQDCIKKGRFNFLRKNQKGENNYNAKPGLIERYKSIKKDRLDGFTYKKIKEKYNIKSDGHVKKILDFVFD